MVYNWPVSVTKFDSILTENGKQKKFLFDLHSASIYFFFNCRKIRVPNFADEMAGRQGCW